MPINLNEFISTFVEESLEMLQATEKTLLNSEKSQNDIEDINQLFRHMHSLKGSSSIFKFTLITDLAHTLETFLDQARSGIHTFTSTDKEDMLKAVDCLRSMVMNVKNQEQLGTDDAKKLTDLFQQKTQHPDEPKIINDKIVSENITTSEKHNAWEIDFQPNKDCFRNLIEPIRLLQSLNELGKTKNKLDTTRIPTLLDCNPTECYLQWHITLYADVTSSEIHEIFDWFSDAKEVSINPILASNEATKEAFKRQSDHAQMHASSTTVRVATDKIDHMMNIVGELIVNQSMLTKITTLSDEIRPENLYEGLANLEKTSRELQESILRMRMIPVEYIFTRFPRMIHDLSNQMHKETELIIAGEKTELDKNMMEKLNDPLVHLIRNAVAHGIELPDIREKKGKPRVGVIQLNAYQEGSNIIIDIADDGNGLDIEKIRAKGIEKGLLHENEEASDDKIYRLIFQPGFSTNESVSEIAGRGVGLDVVHKNVSELGGDIGIETTKGIGTVFKLRLPLTLVIMDAQLVKVNTESYIIPLISIIEMMKLNISHVNSLDLKSSLYHFRDEYIPLINLSNIIGTEDSVELKDKSIIIVSSTKGEQAALVVDELLSQQQVIIKNVEDNYKKIPGIAGVTILGDGSVVLILDVMAIIELNIQTKQNVVISDSSKFEIESASADLIGLENKTNETSKILTFEIDGMEFGIDINVVNEIRTWEETTHIPYAPAYIKGLINVRGAIIPIVDLNERFMNKPGLATKNTIVISLMIESHGKTRYVGVMVNKVLETHPLHNDDIKPLPINFQSNIKKYTKGVITIENKMVALLNPQQLASVLVE